MKSKWIRKNLTVVLIACVMWSFFVLLSIRAYAETGPFCELCQLVTVEHMTRDEYNTMMTAFESALGSGMTGLYAVYVTNVDNGGQISALRDYVLSLIDQFLISGDYGGQILGYLDTIQANNDANYQGLSDAWTAYDLMAATVRGVSFQSVEYCVTCTASGDSGDGSGDGDCCCNCPDYAPILQEMSDRIQSQSETLLSIKASLLTIQGIIESWYVKWQAQDDKLQPLIDELQPMLSNIKRFYDDYYGSSFDSAAWDNIKTVVQAIEQKDIISDFDRLLNDYVGSSMNSAAWSSFAYTAMTWENILSTTDGFAANRTGAQTITKFLTDFSEQVERPYGSHEKLHDVTESEYKHLNWFQRVTVALGILAYPSTNTVSNPSLVNLDDSLKVADSVKGSVTDYTGSVKDNIKGLYDSFKGVYNAFKDVIPADSFPTSIRIHGGWTFSHPGIDSDVVAIQPVDWITGDTPSLQAACDLLRTICGLAWSVLGFFLMFNIVRNVYSYALTLVEKVLAVVGSMGRSGGSGSSGV